MKTIGFTKNFMHNGNIAIVCSGFPIPTETFIIAQILSIREMGYHVDIFPYKRWPDLPGDFENYGLKKHVYPAFVPPVSYFKRLLKALQYGWQYRKYSWRFLKTLNPFILGKSALDLTVFYSCLSFLDRPKYQYFIANFGDNGISLEKLARCGFLTSPFISWFHGFDMSSHQYILKKRNDYLKVFQHCLYAVGVSHYMCNTIHSLGCASSKIQYIPCAPMEDFFKLRNDYINNNFLMVGRLVEKKAPLLTIQAFAKVWKHFPEARLIIVGDGPLKESCEEWINSHHIGNIEFKGVLNHIDVCIQFTGAFCFVQHSITAASGDSEGTPVSILEAGAAGLPVVATLHGGIPDVVQHDITGMLVKEKDVDDMAEKMTILFCNRDLAKNMGMAGRKYVEEHFGNRKYQERLHSMLKAT